MAGSLLNTLSMNELICKNIEEYIQKAIELSINKKIFDETVARLKNQKNESILFDGAAYARNIELSYKAISTLINNDRKIIDIDVS
jgi:predicted O-linked N-acetylglucosamine transferase (SPINDLY family)